MPFLSVVLLFCVQRERLSLYTGGSCSFAYPSRPPQLISTDLYPKDGEDLH